MEFLACLCGHALSSESVSGSKARIRFPEGVFFGDGDRDALEDAPLASAVEQPAGSLDESAPKGFEGAKSVNPDPSLPQCLRWWQADAWMDVVPDTYQFLRSFTFECLPTAIAGLLCWVIESRTSAENRRLVLRPGTNASGVIFQDIMLTTPPWVILIMWLMTDWDVAPIEVLFPFILLGWRAACIAAKYAYFAPSDVQQLRHLDWTKSGRGTRVLGLHRFFNVAGTLELDHLESLCKNAVRIGILPDVRDGVFDVGAAVATKVWRRVRPELEESSNVKYIHSRALVLHIPECHLKRSKYGDVRAVLGIKDIEALERSAEEGRLPVIVVAYYFVSRAFGTLKHKRATLVILFSIMLSFVNPVVRLFSGAPAFGTNATEHAVYGLQVWSTAWMYVQVLLFFHYPPIEAMKRLLMSDAILAAFGRGEACADELFYGVPDHPRFSIRSMGDLKAFWALSRLLGPTFEVGIMTRYNSAFVAISVFFLCVATLGLVKASRAGLMPWGVYAELSILFLGGALSIVSASLLCVKLNRQVDFYQSIARRAGLDRPELGGVAKDVAADIGTENFTLNPVRIMYMRATPALISFLWSGLVALTTVHVSALPGICMPLGFANTC